MYLILKFAVIMPVIIIDLGVLLIIIINKFHI